VSTGHWQIVLPSSSVDAGKSDPRIGPLLALARAANAITLARGPLIAPLEGQTPAVARERFSALFYVGAILFEALHTSEELEKHFSALPPWQTGLGALLSDQAVTDFRKRTLKRFRDKGAFHFDSGFFGRAASRWPNDDIILASLTSNRIGDVYVNSADDLLFAHVLGPFASDDAMVAAFSEFLTTTIDVMNRFLQSAHELMPSAFASLGAIKQPPAV
jgi:hypothetical protein